LLSWVNIIVFKKIKFLAFLQVELKEIVLFSKKKNLISCLFTNRVKANSIVSKKLEIVLWIVLYCFRKKKIAILLMNRIVFKKTRSSTNVLYCCIVFRKMKKKTKKKQHNNKIQFFVKFKGFWANCISCYCIVFMVLYCFQEIYKW
jgi:hypothetical protein